MLTGIGSVASLRDEILFIKPVLVDTLMRNALQDDLNFEKVNSWFEIWSGNVANRNNSSPRL